MSAETAAVLGVASSNEVAQLVADVAGARRRASKAEPGERGDIERFEVLATQLEMLADTHATVRIDLAGSGDCLEVFLLGGEEDDWGSGLPANAIDAARTLRAQGLVPVLRVYGLEPGGAAEPTNVRGVPPVVERFDAGGKKGRAAVEARFRDQISKALASAAAGGEPHPISPSGIQNPVVTEILREAVAGDRARRVDVPVEYRDGSRSANPFPLRCLSLLAEIKGAVDRRLRFALLSIRHTEMDAAVDGAWLRNAEISRPRPAALTDDLVYDISRAQLDELTDHGRRVIHLEMYQTGLETAVVGFYRAVTAHLLAHPGTVAVEPMYFASAGGDVPFRRGTPWTM